MKKLVSIFCCALCMHSITKAPSDLRVVSPKPSGEKVLIKALTALVNREENKKLSSRRIHIPSKESLWLYS